MKKYFCSMVFLLINTFVFSNDSRIVLGSSVGIVDNKNTNITMLNEVINITLYRDYYEVDVTFDFYNDGFEENILLGFPVKTLTYDNPKEREWAQVIDFESYINGVLLTEYTIREESEKDFYLSTIKWFIREVKFLGNSHTYSRVTYKAPYNTYGFFIGAGYIYGTGSSWKGNIGKMTLIINHGDNIFIDDVFLGLEKEKFMYTSEASGKHKFVQENVELEGTEGIRIMIRYFDFLGEYKGQFGESWDGEWVWDRILLHDYFSRDHHFFTRNQVRLFISYFYAMHGYNFFNPLYSNYFKYSIPSWQNNYLEYKMNPDFSESSFNEFERKNIDFLLNIEKNIPFDVEYFPMNLEINSTEATITEYETNVIDNFDHKNIKYLEKKIKNNLPLFIILICVFVFITLIIIYLFIIRKK